MLVHRRVTLSVKFAGTHLYIWVEKGTMRVKCLPKNTTQCLRPGLEPGPLSPETSALTMRPPRLLTIKHYQKSFRYQTFSRLDTLFVCIASCLTFFDKIWTTSNIWSNFVKHFVRSNMFDTVSPTSTTSTCLVTKQCLMAFGCQTFPVYKSDKA